MERLIEHLDFFCGLSVPITIASLYIINEARKTISGSKAPRIQPTRSAPLERMTSLHKDGHEVVTTSTGYKVDGVRYNVRGDVHFKIVK